MTTNTIVNDRGSRNDETGARLINKYYHQAHPIGAWLVDHYHYHCDTHPPNASAR